jgi:D-alanine-D-alanine ligase
MPFYEEDYSQIADPLQWLLTYEAKWLPDSHYYNHIFVRCPADVSPELARRVHDTVTRAYRAMGMRDFGRMDVRLRDGVPYVIDINDLPDLSIGSGFPQNALAAGYEYPQAIEQILDLALRREGWRT